jgi:hypothetical protein
LSFGQLTASYGQCILTAKAGSPKSAIDENLFQRRIEFAAVNDDEGSLVENYRRAFDLKALAKLSFWRECLSKEKKNPPKLRQNRAGTLKNAKWKTSTQKRQE